MFFLALRSTQGPLGCIRAAKKCNKPTLDAMKAEGAEYGGRILDYELTLSEYFNSLPKASGGDRRSANFKSDTAVAFEKGKIEVIGDLGFSRKEVERIQQLTPEAVEQAKTAARENNDIPTRSLALQIAKQDKKTLYLSIMSPLYLTQKNT